MTTRICPVCGNEFQVFPKHPDVKFCSQTCFGLSKRKRTTLNCPGCGIEFTQHSTTQKYCSAECGFKYRPRPGKNSDRWDTYTCKYCGKVFEGRVYRNPVYCSHQCMSEFAARQPKLKARKPDTYIVKQCIVCGKDYNTDIHQVRLRGSTCCSRGCAAVRQSQIKRGAGNPNYIGGTRFPNRGSNWSTQRKKALKRDGYKCRVCGKKIRRFKHDYGVHHITPYKEFEGDFEKANELSNLITLCRECHGKAESGVIHVQRSLL